MHSCIARFEFFFFFRIFCFFLLFLCPHSRYSDQSRKFAIEESHKSEGNVCISSDQLKSDSTNADRPDLLDGPGDSDRPDDTSIAAKSHKSNLNSDSINKRSSFSLFRPGMHKKSVESDKEPGEAAAVKVKSPRKGKMNGKGLPQSVKLDNINEKDEATVEEEDKTIEVDVSEPMTEEHFEPEIDVNVIRSLDSNDDHEPDFKTVSNDEHDTAISNEPSNDREEDDLSTVPSEIDCDASAKIKPGSPSFSHKSPPVSSLSSSHCSPLSCSSSSSSSLSSLSSASSPSSLSANRKGKARAGNGVSSKKKANQSAKSIDHHSNQNQSSTTVDQMELLRSSSIAHLRARALEHSAKVMHRSFCTSLVQSFAHVPGAGHVQPTPGAAMMTTNPSLSSSSSFSSIAQSGPLAAHASVTPPLGATAGLQCTPPPSAAAQLVTPTTILSNMTNAHHSSTPIASVNSHSMSLTGHSNTLGTTTTTPSTSAGACLTSPSLFPSHLHPMSGSAVDPSLLIHTTAASSPPASVSSSAAHSMLNQFGFTSHQLHLYSNLAAAAAAAAAAVAASGTTTYSTNSITSGRPITRTNSSSLPSPSTDHANALLPPFPPRPLY